jgi:hypothetical protein
MNFDPHATGGWEELAQYEPAGHRVQAVEPEVEA